MLRGLKNYSKVMIGNTYFLIDTQTTHTGIQIDTQTSHTGIQIDTQTILIQVFR